MTSRVSELVMENFYKKVDYQYNIRGWLKAINDIDDLQSGTDPQDLFAFKLNYSSVLNPTWGGSPLYNGNISESFWRTASDNTLRQYSYIYDNLNRLLLAVYRKPESSIFNSGSYNEGISYDKNGNIESLQRTGEYDDMSQNLLIDDLVYSYNSTKPNELVKVDDHTNNPNGFKDGVNTGNDYLYDANGNMTVDHNKGITLIRYNHLNLPTKITFGTSGNIEYIYNASGVKVRKIVTEGSTIQTTDYSSGFQYVNGNLEFFPHAEGYVKNVNRRSDGTPNPPGVYRYVYNYTDHLGNIRLSYTKDPQTNVLTILEENNYYPFGLKHRNYNMTKKHYEKLENNGDIVIIPTNQTIYDYKYNGKEWQDELGLNFYDYGARNYDPAIGRWMNMDPLGEVMPSWSPYTYVFNNPLSFIDPDGKIPYPITIRSFAPFKTFGGGFHGDNRGYTTASATARVHQSINFDTDKTTISARAWSSSTSHTYLPGSRTAKPSVEFTDGFKTRTSGDSKTFMFGTHSKGGNPMVPGSPNIDVFSDFSITENKKAGTLDISGTLTGDNFPSTEAFISDPSGQNVFLGIGQIGADVGRNTGPMTELSGENKDNPITSFNFSISTDKKGNFTGVIMGDITYSIEEWNKTFTSQSTQK